MDKKKILDISLLVGLPIILYAVLFTPSLKPAAHQLTITTKYVIGTVLIETIQVTITLVALLFAAKVRLADIGLYSFKMSDLLKVTKGLMILLTVFALSSLLFLLTGQNNNFALKLDTSILMLAVMMICVGYCEELFFRVYAYESFCRHIDPRAAAIISAFLFCCGHFYEGYTAVVIIFFLGLTLQYLYKKYRSIHVIAIVHALFNVISTVIGTSTGSSL